MNQPTAPKSPANIDLTALQSFVLEAQKLYGSGNIKLDKANDGRKTLTVESEILKLTDEFDGGNPFCGIERLVQKADNHVVWNSYYHGWLTNIATELNVSAELVFNFLREALNKPTNDMPLRGPKLYKGTSGLRYENKLEFGGFDCFFGSETIYDDKENLLYYGRYGGGLVDLSEDMGEA